MNLTISDKNAILLGSERIADFLLPKNRVQSRLEKFNRFSLTAEMHPFLLEDSMSKHCCKCKKEKALSEFLQYKSGINKGYYHSYCKNCEAKYKHQRTVMLKKYPWFRTYRRILNRIYSNEYCKKYYKDRGIKNELSIKDLKYLWFRDKAYLMERPSIDRINPFENYSIKNCRYLELIDNIRRTKRMK